MQVRRGIRDYPAVGVVLLTALVGIVLEVTGPPGAARWVVSAVALGIAALQLRGMVADLRAGTYGVDVLAVTAVVSTVAVGEYWAALVVCLMLTGGEALEDYASARAGRELTSLLERAPSVALRELDGGGTERVDVAVVRPGDRLVVRPHEVVPVDTVLDSDDGVFDESSLTGESLPVERVRGDRVLSGALNGAAAVRLVATATAADSQYQRIVTLVKEAQESRAPFVRLADRVAVPFTLTAFLIAGLAWGLSGDPLRFAQVLVVATPCPLIIAAPVAFMAGMSRGARGGMIVKDAGTLEQLSKVRTVAFDKTGTLTHGRPEVVAVHVVPAARVEEVLAAAAAVEAWSAHPLARAVVAAARERGEVPVATDAREVPAHGVEAVVEGTLVRVGKLAFAAPGAAGGVAASSPPEESAATSSAPAGHTQVHVSRDGLLVGTIVLADVVRAETTGTLAQLHRMGIARTVMLTGDAEGTARRVAAQVGLDDVRAGLLPEDKVTAVTGLPDRPVLMVGDGVNDAPVLAAADVGVAMGARGSAAAVESADVVVMLDDLARVPRLVLLGRHTMRVAWQAIAIGVGLSVVLMLVGATGRMPAFVGAWMQEVVDLACILWALLAARPSAAERALTEEQTRGAADQHPAPSPATPST
ncbi:heavy metal translocating P-type ATPase [Ornithinimicrobium sp. W1665]|uniref:heavy metal translocating P-type ATPase n=1 Tax=Ornithinimicrobium sp. W1665 TaxID=3416666 RepID=UPI003CEEABE2